MYGKGIRHVSTDHIGTRHQRTFAGLNRLGTIVFPHVKQQ